MRYAFNEQNDRIEVSSSGERAKCPDCGAIVIGRKGQFKIAHWYHKTKNECDSWYEPITEWHLKWQNLFPEDCREVSITGHNYSKSHRADIRLKNNLVIEVQNSPINVEEIEEREHFYGKNNMIWILNGESLASRSEITYQFTKKRFALLFSVPTNSAKVAEYDMEEFKENLWKNELLSGLKTDKDLIEFEIDNGNYFKFDFKADKDFEEIESELSYLCRKICNELYEYGAYQKLISGFNIMPIRREKDEFSKIDLTKKYWRKFIDRMTFPVFIDNLNGLENDLMYWYQKNKIIKRSDFISKYLKYT